MKTESYTTKILPETFTLLSLLKEEADSNPKRGKFYKVAWTGNVIDNAVRKEAKRRGLI
jgi:hypothetical protein